MKKMNVNSITSLSLLFGFLLIVALAGCQKKEDVTNPYDSSYFYNGATPVITSVTALNGDAAHLSAIGKIRITGSNFSTNIADNLVNFNLVRGTVLSATSTQLDVQVPIYVSDSIMIRVDVSGENAAPLPSNTIPWYLKQPLVEDDILSGQEVPSAMCFDAGGTLYASIENGSGVSAGIIKVSPSGAKTLISTPANVSSRVFSNIRCANGGNLYLISAGSKYRVWVLASGTTTPIKYADVPTDNILYGMDFDANMNLWVGGESATKNLHSITSNNQTVTSFSYSGKVKALRIYNGYLYIAGMDSSDWKYRIYRYQLNSNSSIGAKELYYDFNQAYPDKSISSLTFSSDGYLYIGIFEGTGGASSQPGIVLVNPGGTVSEDYYKGILTPSVAMNNSAGYYAMMWNNQTLLYAIRIWQTSKTDGSGTITITTNKKLVKINTLKTGAVYYGR